MNTTDFETRKLNKEKMWNVKITQGSTACGSCGSNLLRVFDHYTLLAERTTSERLNKASQKRLQEKLFDITKNA